MIKYIPIRRTLAASVKEEQIFHTMEELVQFIEERAHRFFMFVGNDRIPQITITEPAGDDPRIGWVNVRSIFVGHECVGFCGE